MPWLLNHGADVNAQGGGGMTSLYSAVLYQNTRGFHILIEHNADIHTRDDDGESPLHATARCPDRDRVNMMQVLLDHGANPNARDNNLSTPLHFLSRSGGQEAVEGTRLLLKHGAIIDAEDEKGRTPLQLASEGGLGDIATCLKEHGATR